MINLLLKKIMETIIHAKTIDKKVRLALYGMLHHSATKLFPRRMKYVSIKLHLKHYVFDGVAMIEEIPKLQIQEILRLSLIHIV